MLKVASVFILWISFYPAQSIRAQSVLNIPVSGSFQNITLFEFVQILENRYNVRFYYVPDKLPVYTQSLELEHVPLFEALESFLKGSLLKVVKYKDIGIVLITENNFRADYIEGIITKWDQGIYTKPVKSEPQYLDLLFGDSTGIPDGKTFVLTGTLRDKYTNEPIVGAIIQDQASGFGLTSDEQGSFSYSLPVGKNSLLIQYLGYQTVQLQVEIYKDGSIDLDLQVWTMNLEEIVVEGAAALREVDDTRIGVEAMSIKEIKELPSFLGEADILKSLELLPGVNSVGEASTGFNVRGGNLDQNLVLVDEAILFNTSHALGLFSILNPDVVRNFSLFKGSIPAQYGGRLSSVLNIELKEGNSPRWQGSGGLGLASSRIMVEGPLSHRTGLLIGLRSSYSNWLIKTLEAPDVRNSRVYFGDGLFKLIHQLNDRNQLALSGYASYDYFRFAKDFGYTWASTILSLRWRYLVSNRVTLLSHLVKGGYQSRQFEPEGSDAFNYYSGIDYWKAKSNLSFQGANHFLQAGLEILRYEMRPEELEPVHTRSGLTPVLQEKDQAWDASFYLNDDIDLTDDFSISVGARISFYRNIGPRQVYIYTDGLPRISGNIQDSLQFRRSESIATYQGFEPRLSFHYRLNELSALKLSYNRQTQNLHLISNSTTATPTALWQLSNFHFEPASSDNFSIGYFREYGDVWESAVELYYKKARRLLEFKDLADLLLNEQLETEVVSGTGKAYGMEFSVSKKYGLWTGNLAYTYSRSLIKFNNELAGEQINNGKWFPSSYDQPHQFNIQIKHSMNPVHSFQIHFTYKQGRPVTAPVGAYLLGDVLVTNYSERNRYRIPDYHRLDLSYTLDRTQSRMKGLKSSFTLAFYNVYGRKNPYTIFFQRDERGIHQAYKLSVLGSVFPSLTWNFIFN